MRKVAIGPDGFEPSPPVPKTGVLPLDDGPAFVFPPLSRAGVYRSVEVGGLSTRERRCAPGVRHFYSSGVTRKRTPG